MSDRGFSAKRVVAAVAILGFFASCGEITTTPLNPDKQNVLHGVITSGSAPLQGVTVSGGVETVSSDSSGNYRTYVPAGDSTIVFSKAGYAEVSKAVTAGRKSTIQADIVMTEQAGATQLASDEYIVREGHYVEIPINPSSGWIEFDVTLDESGRSYDWDKQAIISIYDGTYHGAVGGLVDLLPYKLKWCYATTCKEPRYNLTWGTWRHVRLEWTTTEVWASIDGTKVGGGLIGPFDSNDTSLIYGDHPNSHGPLPGARMKNFSRSN